MMPAAHRAGRRPALRNLILPSLVIAGPVLAQVQVKVTSPVALAYPGMAVPLRAEVTGAGPDCVWSVPDGAGAVNPWGVFKAPPVEGFRICTVRASSAHDPAAWGEASLLVWGAPLMVDGITQLLRGYTGPEGWSSPCAVGRWAFRDFETGDRYAGKAATVVKSQEAVPSLSPTQMVGYGLPVPLAAVPALGHPRPSTATFMLSLQTLDGSWERTTGTRARPPVIQAIGTLQDSMVESLQDLPTENGPAVLSQFWMPRLRVRGMVPLAGHPALDPGDEDGRGLGARMREPGGPTLSTDLDGEESCVVPDAASHVVRIVSAGGLARTLCGKPGDAGFRDGAGAEARLHRPTFAASQQTGNGRHSWECAGGLVVSDTGNHAIRRVDPRGQVKTLAGTGQPGYVDADDPAQAQFDQPQGVAVDPMGNTFVADHGNRVVRRIDLNGQVTTLAGSGQPGAEDGEGLQASFTDLKGLTLRHPYDGRLYVVDGHAVREISPQGRVTTLLGKVGEAGYQAYPFLTRRPRWPLTEKACLDGPVGITSFQGALFIADQGNHAVRCLMSRRDPDLGHRCGLLLTLAGDPGEDTHRWGLFQDGLPFLRTRDYAALDAPRGLTFSRSGDAWLATGRCLANLSQLSFPEGPSRGVHSFTAPFLSPPEEHNARVKVGKGMQFGFDVPGAPPRLHAWTYEVVEADSGAAAGDACLFEKSTDFEGRLTFLRAGGFTLRVRYLTEDGVTQYLQYGFQVEP